MDMRTDKPLFTISIVATEVGIHPQTLRLYESRGLITPSRSDGNTRLYSSDDIDKIKRITELSNQGINSRGILQILNLEKEVKTLENSLDNVLKANARLKGEIANYRAERGGQLMKREDRSIILRVK